MLIKLHRSYRTVVAVCDSDLIGKIFEEEGKQLDLRGDFFKGEEKSFKEIVKILKLQKKEDSTFNIIGKKSIEAAKEAGLISKEGVMEIKNIPYALILL
jgi:hypothetical protein